jgi:16S rRNA (uracil1498-N3)-methyltransferase
MRLTRIYIEDTIHANNTVLIVGNAANHIANVLRLRVGDELILFHNNTESRAAIVTINKREVVVETSIVENVNRESRFAIHLIQAIARGEKMDWIIQKATELGVHTITPIITERCGVKLSSERWQKREQHWHSVAISACEQSGRNQLPVINSVIKFTDAVVNASNAYKILFTPEAEQSLHSISTNVKSENGIAFLVGPEGGLSEIELQQAKHHQFQLFRFGSRILRTETAAIAGAAVLQSCFGDLG